LRQFVFTACVASGCMIYDSSLLVGDASDSAVVDAPVNADASGPGFTISAPPTLTLEQGASAPVTVTVTRTGGFSDAITFSVSGLPAGATNNPLTITSDTTTGALTLAISNTTPQSLSHLSIDGVAASGTISASADMDLVVRGPPGSLDVVYGNQGIVSGFLTTANFGGFDGAALDASGNLLLAINGQLLGGPIYVIRIAPNGTLDATFGTAGIATVPDTGVVFDAVFPLPSGEIELCGLSEMGAPWKDEIVRLTSTGAVDSSYSPDGGVGNTIPRTDGQVYVFNLDSMGRVVETGFTGNEAGFLLTRRTAMGALDSTFNVAFDSSVGGFGQATTIQPDGRIVASFSSSSSPYAMGIVRTDSSGNLDPTFGTNGIVSATGGVPLFPAALFVQSDGKLVTGGLPSSEGAGGLAARFEANGAVDVTYGSGGTAQLLGNVWAMAQQSDNAVIAAGYPNAIAADAGLASNDVWVERLTAGGLPDTAFGVGGIVVTSVGAPSEITIGQWVGVQQDGRIVVIVATMKSQGVYDFSVARYWP
jgi:uncharacterized delta-60 repeat protein